jgi:hypothetical protein
MSDSALVAPQPHELDVVVFGPGVGESILLHLGENDWFVIDSCRYPGEHTPAALKYLSSIGVDPSVSIKRILATHWHDDHIRGLGDIVRECPNAKFAMSGALAGEQFFQLVLEVEASNKLVSGSSSATEFADIFEELRRRGQSIAYPDFYAQDAMLLFKDGGYRKTAFVQAVSPSPATVTHAMADVASKIMTTGGVRRFRHLSPNDLSVAVHVQVGGLSLLLGSDLENTDDAAFGWKAVLVSPSLPSGKSQVFKVAHHGSPNADHINVWSTLLGNDPVSVVTPYTRLSQPLPSESDIERIKQYTRNLFCTTWPPSAKPPRRPGVDKLVETATKKRWAMNRKPGFVRIRIDLSAQQIASPEVQTFGSARGL